MKTTWRSVVIKRGLLLLAIALTFSMAWVTFSEIHLDVIGQPTATGPIQYTMEAPFFLELAKTTGLSLKVSYRPLDESGLRDTHQLQMLQQGVFDLVSLRFPENSQAEPSLQGIDLVGIYPDYEVARRAVDQYSVVVDRYLRESFDAKLLGVWPFGPQVFFCRVPIQGSIDDLNGLKIRVASTSMATLISGLGGIPVPLSFGETKEALASGLIDCAITGGASANFASWPEHAQYYFPLVVHFGLNGYAISLRKWQEFSPQQQKILTQAFADYLDDLWAFSQALHEDASDCNIGRNCQYGSRYNLTLVEPSVADVQRFKEVAQLLVVPEWAERCEQIHQGCRQEWEERVLRQVP